MLAGGDGSGGLQGTWPLAKLLEKGSRLGEPGHHVFLLLNEGET